MQYFFSIKIIIIWFLNVLDGNRNPNVSLIPSVQLMERSAYIAIGNEDLMLVNYD